MGQYVGAGGQEPGLGSMCVCLSVSVICRGLVQWVCRRRTHGKHSDMWKTAADVPCSAYVPVQRGGSLSLLCLTTLAWTSLLGKLFSCSESKLSKAHEIPKVEFCFWVPADEETLLPLGWSKYSTTLSQSPYH